VFDPYVEFIVQLCRRWETYHNVVAVELLNEPPISGLPNLYSFLTLRQQIFRFYGAVFEALKAESSPIEAPIAIGDWGDTVPTESALAKILAFCGPIPSSVRQTLEEMALNNRLILSFHYYKPPAAVSLQDCVSGAQEFAAELGQNGKVPIWLSEYFEPSAQEFAASMLVAVDSGCNAVTYWQQADTEYTGTNGWFKYPPSVTSQGSGVPVDENGKIDEAAWAAYQKTVFDGHFYGASITGACGAQMDVLNHLPARHPSGMLHVPQQVQWPAAHFPWETGHKGSHK
jgi:hypothetical protein